MPVTSYQYGWDTPVLLKDIINNTVTRFNNQTELSRYLKYSMPGITQYLKEGKQRVFRDRYQIKYDDDEPWRIIEDILRDSSLVVAVVVIDKDNNETIYKTALECAKAMKILPTTLNYRLNTQGTRVFRDGNRYRRY